MTGLELWNRLEETDVRYTTSFDAGSFKGTAVDAAYNIKRVTEQLGPVGFAWGWEVREQRHESYGSGADAQVVHTCVVRAWFRQQDGSKDYVENVGATKAAYWTRPRRPGDAPRFIVDSEAAKKSVTDALSRIMMSLGASADIWLGRFDGNKYVAPARDEQEPAGDGHAADEALLVHARDLVQEVRVASTGEAVIECARKVKGVFDSHPFWPRLVHADRDLAAELQGMLRGKAQIHGLDLSKV